MTRVENAMEKHKVKKYNCSQCVATVFADILGMDESHLFQMSAAFGYGMGSMQATCGAVSAGALVIGLLMNNGNTEDSAQKIAIHKAAKEFTRRFAEKNQSLICHELKGVESGTVLRSCDGCIEDAIVILEEMLEEGRFERQ